MNTQPENKVCPRCGKLAVKAVFDPMANYGRGATVYFYGNGYRIPRTRLIHSDSCTVNTNKPQ